MRVMIVAASLLAACAPAGSDQASAQAEPEAQAESADAKMSAEEHAALIAATGYALGADGSIENACGTRVFPQTLPADVGGEVGLAWLVIVPGGEGSPTCYGDVPGDMYLLHRDDAGYVVIFAGGGYLSILPETGAGGVHDIALGGPGFSFPVFTWDGAAYAPADRTVSDEEFARHPMLP